MTIGSAGGTSISSEKQYNYANEITLVRLLWDGEYTKSTRVAIVYLLALETRSSAIWCCAAGPDAKCHWGKKRRILKFSNAHTFSHSMCIVGSTRWLKSVLWFLLHAILFFTSSFCSLAGRLRRACTKKKAISLENVYEFVFNGKNIASYHFGWAQVVTTSHSAVKNKRRRREERISSLFTFTFSLSLLIGIINTRLAARKKRSTALASSGESVPKACEDDAVAVAWATVRAEDERCQVIAWNHRNHDTTHVLRFFAHFSLRHSSLPSLSYFMFRNEAKKATTTSTAEASQHQRQHSLCSVCRTTQQKSFLSPFSGTRKNVENCSSFFILRHSCVLLFLFYFTTF